MAELDWWSHFFSNELSFAIILRFDLSLRTRITHLWLNERTACHRHKITHKSSYKNKCTYDKIDKNRRGKRHTKTNERQICAAYNTHHSKAANTHAFTHNSHPSKPNNFRLLCVYCLATQYKPCTQNQLSNTSATTITNIHTHNTQTHIQTVHLLKMNNISCCYIPNHAIESLWLFTTDASTCVCVRICDYRCASQLVGADCRDANMNWLTFFSWIIEWHDIAIKGTMRKRFTIARFACLFTRILENTRSEVRLGFVFVTEKSEQIGSVKKLTIPISKHLRTEDFSKN